MKSSHVERLLIQPDQSSVQREVMIIESERLGLAKGSHSLLFRATRRWVFGATILFGLAKRLS